MFNRNLYRIARHDEAKCTRDDASLSRCIIEGPNAAKRKVAETISVSMKPWRVYHKKQGTSLISLLRKCSCMFWSGRACLRHKAVPQESGVLCFSCPIFRLRKEFLLPTKKQLCLLKLRHSRSSTNSITVLSRYFTSLQCKCSKNTQLVNSHKLVATRRWLFEPCMLKPPVTLAHYSGCLLKRAKISTRMTALCCRLRTARLTGCRIDMLSRF